MDSLECCYVCGEMEHIGTTFGTVAGAFGKALLYVFSFLFFQSITSLGYSVYYAIMAAAGAYGNVTEEEQMNMINARLSEIFVVSAVLTVVFFVIVFAVRKKSFAKRIQLRVSPGGVGILVVLLGAVLNYVTVVLFDLLPIPEEVLNQHDEVYSVMAEGTPVLVLLASVFLAPVVEEIVYRALAYGTMRKAMPVWAAAVISALIFGISHGTAVSFVYATVLGVLLAYFYEISHSLWVPVLLHFGFNFGSIFVAFAPKESILLYAFAFFAATVIAVALGAVCIVYYTKRNAEAAED